MEGSRPGSRSNGARRVSRDGLQRRAHNLFKARASTHCAGAETRVLDSVLSS